MLASASDDGTVRIWGTEEQMKAQLQYQQEKGLQQRKCSQEQRNGAMQVSGSVEKVHLQYSTSYAHVIDINHPPNLSTIYYNQNVWQ